MKYIGNPWHKILLECKQLLGCSKLKTAKCFFSFPNIIKKTGTDLQIYNLQLRVCRNSRPVVICKKGVLRNFANS